MKKAITRRLTAVFLCSLLIFLVSCADVRPHSKTDDKLLVVSTIFPPYDFARNIGGDAVDAVQLLRPGTESHTYDPTPADMITVQNCDVFLYIGGESDAWVDTLLDAVDCSDKTILRLIDCVDLVEEETVEGMTVHEHEHTHDDADEQEAHEEESDEIEYDEHIWTSPRNAMRLCEAISDAFCQADPDRTDFYRNNLEQYLAALDALDTEFSEIVRNASVHTVVFGDRFPFRYFCDAYGLSYRAAFPGCAAESEPSAATMVSLIEKIRTDGIPAIFTIELSNEKIASAIAGETGVPILQFHSCHNRTAEEADADETYLSLMKKNAEQLKIALNSVMPEETT